MGTSWIPCGIPRCPSGGPGLWRPWLTQSPGCRANTPMTMPECLNDTEREKADGEAVLRHAFHGEPLDREVARRVRERGAQITQEIDREHGEIDPETSNALFRDDHESHSGILNGTGLLTPAFAGNLLQRLAGA